MISDQFDRRDVTLGNWRTDPRTRWSFQNVRELVPTARISDEQESAATGEPADGLSGLSVEMEGVGEILLGDHLEAFRADSVIVAREGKILAEWHAPHVDPTSPHIVFSISKSITGMLAGIAAGDGLLDPEALVPRYLPEVAGSAYETARVRDLLDMTVDLVFEEDYLNRDGPFDRYRRAMLWNPERSDTKPETLTEVLASMPKGQGRHGERYFYASPNTDLLGLVIERATGIRYHRYLAERLWRPMGATGAAYVTVDRIGTARAAGGVCITARDLVRLGQLLLDGGATRNGKQVVPRAWVDDMLKNGDPEAWRKGSFATTWPSGSYRSCWYLANDDHGSFAADGIHGQRLLADPVTRVVVVKLASHGTPADDQATIRDFAVLAALARSF